MFDSIVVFVQMDSSDPVQAGVRQESFSVLRRTKVQNPVQDIDRQKSQAFLTV